jgi:PRTRC genetic system protein E
MFMELVPLLKQRVVMITVSDVGDGVLRVNIIPRKADADSDQNQVLTAPLSITGSAEELDRGLPGQLASFTESVVKTGSNLEALRTQHAAAVKAVEAENKKKLDEKKKASGAKPPSASPAPGVTPEFKDAKPLFGSKPAPAASECPGLFDAPPEPVDGDEVGGSSGDDSLKSSTAAG